MDHVTSLTTTSQNTGLTTSLTTNAARGRR